jgi:predicted CXXCH cytochrome family protein
MRKLRMSFTAIFTLLLVGMLSAVAFASAAGPEIIDWNSSDKHLDFTWGPVATATDYQLWKHVPGEDPEEITLTDGQMSYSVDNLDNSSTVEWEIIAIGTTKAKVTDEDPTTVFYMTAGGPEFNRVMRDDVVSTDGENDNGNVNANQTGKNVGGITNNFADVIKSGGMTNKDGSTSTHRTHGDYANNTNSCASCHQTHTAASKNLLFKNGVYATCTACHDGTLGFYNVFENGAGASKSAGTFGGTKEGHMSVHLATGAVSIKAAPGGDKDGHGTWSAEFTCASCHAPHGSYSDRLLHFNPNGIATTPVADGGQKLLSVEVVDGIPTTKDATEETDYLFVRTKNATPAQLTAAKIYSFKVANPTIIQLYKWVADTDLTDNGGVDQSAYVLDTAPWVYTGTYDASHTYKVYDTAFWNVKPTAPVGKYTSGDLKGQDKSLEGTIYTANSITHPLKKDSFISSANNWIGSDQAAGKTLLDAVTEGDAARAYVVDLDVEVVDASKNVTKTNVSKLWDSSIWVETGAKKSGKGVVMSGFCSACHTDYLASSGSETGVHSTAYRHSTKSDSYTCVRCHFAHGTDVEIMKDAQNKTVADIAAEAKVINPALSDTDATTIATNYMLDKAPSSALKRYTNMSVCWGCHTSSHAEGIRNSSTYGDDSDDPMPGGLVTGQ